MATIKVKLRPSIVEGKEGVLYYQVIHNRLVRQIKTEYKLFTNEWNDRSSEFVLPLSGKGRRNYLLALREKVAWEINRLSKVISAFNRKGMPYTTDDVVFSFQKEAKTDSLFTFMQSLIIRLKELGKVRTSETYATTLNSFMRFRKDRDIMLDDVDADLMAAYEAHLKAGDISMNTVSFYMRILRAVYNRAVEKEITVQRYPFRHVYTGIEKTVKRAVALEVIRQIKELELTLFPSLDYARDMFLFSFYTRGMSFIDMAYLKKKDLQNGVLSYRRKKTGQRLFIKWEPCMQKIVDKYEMDTTHFLLPIVRKIADNERDQYKNGIYLVNRKLKDIAKMTGITIPLTMYVARHSWASIARSRNIPVAVISEGMGHDSETTTQIYLASLDTSVVDNANGLIMRLL